MIRLVLLGLLALAGCASYQPLDDEAFCTNMAAMSGPHCADWRERHWQSSR